METQHIWARMQSLFFYVLVPICMRVLLVHICLNGEHARKLNQSCSVGCRFTHRSKGLVTFSSMHIVAILVGHGTNWCRRPTWIMHKCCFQMHNTKHTHISHKTATHSHSKFCWFKNGKMRVKFESKWLSGSCHFFCRGCRTTDRQRTAEHFYSQIGLDSGVDALPF